MGPIVSWEGEVGEGGKLLHHETISFSGGSQFNICFGEWRQDLKMVAVVAMQVEEKSHQHGD
jgi:hypothetical protein